jgi:hypothetical protein
MIATTLLYIKNTRLIVFASLAFIICTSVYLPKSFGEGTNLLRTYSISSRLNTDLAYVKQYNWELLIGRGMNTLMLEAPPSIYDNHASGPNNSYLYLLATTGVLGLLGWGMFMAQLYSQSAHKPMLAFFFTASLFNNVMFYSFALLWILLVEAMAPSED